MWTWLVGLYEIFFGCSHSRTTFPLTVRSSAAKAESAQRGAYVVCLDCGREFSYDWSQMRMEATPQQAAGPRNFNWNAAPSRGKAA